MDKKELEQIRKLSKEIEIIKTQIDNVSTLPRGNHVIDTVQGSSPTFPYSAHKIVIEGADTYYDRRVKAIQNRLTERLNEYIDLVAKAWKYIDELKDSETRIILSLHYINNESWEQVAEDSGLSLSTVYRIYKRWRTDIV